MKQGTGVTYMPELLPQTQSSMMEGQGDHERTAVTLAAKARGTRPTIIEYPANDHGREV